MSISSATYPSLVKKHTRNPYTAPGVERLSSLDNRRVNAAGFTLLEILVAVFILAIVLSTIFAMFTDTIENINDTETQADIYQMARIAMDRIQEDLECSLIVKTDDEPEEEDAEESSPGFFSGEDETIDDRDADSVSFLSTNHISLDDEDKDSGLSRIAFYVKKHDEENGLILYRSDTPEREQVIEEKTGGFILCHGLHSVNLIYYNSEGDEYESWDSSSGEYKDKLPSRICIQLFFLDESNPENPYKFETGIALPMAGDGYSAES